METDSFHFLSYFFHSSIITPLEYIYGRLSTQYELETINLAPLGFLTSSCFLIMIPFVELFGNKTVKNDENEESNPDEIKDSLKYFTEFNSKVN